MVYYSGGDAPSARLGIEYEFSGATASLHVTGVEPGTPAEARGLRAGDEIVAVNGRAFTSERPVHDEIRHAQPGTDVRLTVRRADGAVADLAATLIEPRPVTRTFGIQVVTQGALRLYPLGFFVVLVGLRR